MTITSPPIRTLRPFDIEALPEPPPPPPPRSLPWRSAIPPIGLALAAAAGTITIGISYGRATTSGADRTHYPIFWLGVLIFMIPAALYLCAAATSRLARVGTLVGIALFLDVPKILRDPTGPLYHDELAHWRQVQDIAAAGHLFVPNSIIPIIRDYPGLHLVTLTLQRATGFSTWGAAIMVLLVAHALSLMAVYLLVEGHTGRARPAAIAALIYATNSSYMYFHTQFAYESLAISLFLLVLLAMQRLERAPTPAERRAWAAMAVCVSAMLVTTHHLSSLFLLGALAVWAAVAWHNAHRERSAVNTSIARCSSFVAISELAILAVWFTFVAPKTLEYLSPYLGNAIKQLLTVAGGKETKVRTVVFVHTTQPLWERGAALASPLIMLVVAGAVVYRMRKHRDRSATATTLTLLALCYFPSLPFILSASGAEGARRSWGFSYAGLGFLIAPAVCAVIEGTPRLSPIKRFAAWPAVLLISLALFAVVLVGNVAAGLNEYYRFPGPYAFGSDTRSFTPELVAMSDWFLDELGPDNRAVSDRYTSLSLAAWGQQRMGAPAAGFPAYDLWFYNRRPSQFLLRELYSSHYRYLVIDKRTALEKPIVGIYFSPDEPGSRADQLPISTASLEKFDSYPWTEKVFESNDYVVYRFQFGSLNAHLAPRHK